MSTYFLPCCLHKFQPVRLTGGFLEGEGVISFFYVDTMGVLQLGIFSGDDLALSSWWSRLYEKLAVSGRLGLVLDKATDAKRGMRPNTLGVSFPFLSLS